MNVVPCSDWDVLWPLWRRVVSTGETYMWAPSTSYMAARDAWMLPPPAVVYGAFDGPSVVGTALLKPAQPALGDHIANAAFMIDPLAAGKGYGRTLATFVLDDARSRGYTAMQFNAVVSTNTAAVRLWESLGFTTLARVPDAFRHPSLGFTDTLVMHRRL